MRIDFTSSILSSSINSVPISYADLIYASLNMTPTSFRIWLYILSHPNQTIHRDKVMEVFHCDNKVIYNSRLDMERIGVGGINNDGIFTCFNTVLGKDEPYIPTWTNNN